MSITADFLDVFVAGRPASFRRSATASSNILARHGKDLRVGSGPVRFRKTTDHRRARRVALVLPALVTLMVGFLAPAAQATLRSRYLDIINNARVHHDLRPLKLNAKLSDTAAAHPRSMIREGRLFDVANLAGILSPYSGYETLGADVVGCGDTLFRMHGNDASRRSPQHPAEWQGGLRGDRRDPHLWQIQLRLEPGLGDRHLLRVAQAQVSELRLAGLSRSPRGSRSPGTRGTSPPLHRRPRSG
jgi:hypothetical protein